MYWLEQFFSLYWFDYIFLITVSLLIISSWVLYRTKAIKHNWLRRGLSLMSLTTGVLFFYSLFIEPNVLVTKTYSLDVPTAELNDPIRLVVIGDLQAKAHLTPSWMSYVAYRINLLQPDYIVWTGDLIEQRLEDLEIISGFENLRAGKAKIAILGNHDYRLYMHDPINLQIRDKVAAFFESKGFTVLDNQILLDRYQGQTINFAGTPDRWSGKIEYSFLNAAVELNQADINLLITHQPISGTENPNPELYDIVLAGHCHGGQINLGIFNPLMGLPKVPDGCFEDSQSVKGLFTKQGVQFLVTPGIGSMRYRMRFFSPPEISLLEIY